MQLLEAELGRPIDQILRELYVEQGLDIRAVGDRLGVTKGTVSRWLTHFHIPTRRGGTARRAVTP